MHYSNYVGLLYRIYTETLSPSPSFRAIMVRRAWPIHVSTKVSVQLHGISRGSACRVSRSQIQPMLQSTISTHKYLYYPWTLQYFTVSPNEREQLSVVCLLINTTQYQRQDRNGDG